MNRELRESGLHGAEEITQTLISAVKTSDSDAIQAPLAGIKLHRKWEAKKCPAEQADREKTWKTRHVQEEIELDLFSPESAQGEPDQVFHQEKGEWI